MQSIRNKCGEVMEHLSDYEADIVFVSETWMEADSNDITAAIKASGYTLIHDRRRDREKELGGDVGVIIRSTMTYNISTANHFHHLNILWLL